MRCKKKVLAIGLVLVFAFGLFAGHRWNLMGLIDPPSAPETTESYTLDDIYERLDAGIAATKSTFTEPEDVPGTGTMHTLDEIYDLIPEHKDSFNGSQGARVLSIPDGIYKGGKTATAVDADLVAGNITDGVEIFDVTGSNPTCVQCTGTLSPQSRWCDNGDGTVTDMSTGLVWYEDASWGGQHPWWAADYEDAHRRAAELDSRTEPNLNDGSDYGDWRLPTANELLTLTSGDEPLLLAHGLTYFFINVQEDKYWSSTTVDGDSSQANTHDLGTRSPSVELKTNSHYVWPVRGP